MRYPDAGAVAIVLSILAASGAAAGELVDGRPVIADMTGDLNGDGVPDRAVLTAGQEEGADAGLAVYLSADGRLPAAPTLHNPAIGWMGALAGTVPALSVNRRGSLVAEFQNDSIGRNRWNQTLTIAFRNGALVVAGYTYTTRDTLDPDASGTCDVNLLSGKGTRNGKAVTVSSGPVRLADWSDQSVPKACAFE